MDIRIREAGSRDYEALCLLFEQLDEIHRRELPHIFRKPAGPARGRAYIEEILGDPDVCILLACAGEQPVGFVTGMLRDTPAIDLLVPARLVVVDNLYVDSEYRRSGLGRGMMQAIEAWAKRSGAEYVELHVYEFNTQAVAFYERLGYTTLSRRMRKIFSDGT